MTALVPITRLAEAVLVDADLPFAPDVDARAAHVYFVRAGVDGPIKIGYAGNVAGRLSELQSGNPHQLVVAATIAVVDRLQARRLEAELHRLFVQHRIRRGEWFRPVYELIAFVEAARRVGALALTGDDLSCSDCGCSYARRRSRPGYDGGKWCGELCGDTSGGVNTDDTPCRGFMVSRENAAIMTYRQHRSFGESPPSGALGSLRGPRQHQAIRVEARR